MERLRSFVRVTTIQPKPLLQSSQVSLLNQMRSGTCWVQANWQVTVKSSVDKLAGVFASQITAVQEGGAAWQNQLQRSTRH